MKNRRAPHKSKPHGELASEDAGSGNAQKRIQNKSMMGGTRSDLFAGRADAGAGAGPQPRESGSFSGHGHTGKDDDPVKPKNRRQVR